MKINRHNYESFFIDYLDGNLKGKDLSDFQTFLETNPDLMDELRDFESCQLLVSEERYPEKRNLKKHIHDITDISENNFEEICIAHYEGDLNAILEKNLQEYLKANPDQGKIYNLYSNTFIKPDLNIRFNKKGLLKKRVIVPKRKWILYAAASVAAAILLVTALILDNTGIQTSLSTRLATSVPLKENNVDAFNVSKNNEKLSIDTTSTNTENGTNYTKEKQHIIIPSSLNHISQIKDTTIRLYHSNRLYAEKLEAISIDQIPCCPQPYETKIIPQYGFAANYITDVEKGSLELKDIALYELRSFIYQDEIESRKKFSFWDIAEASINTLNKISDADIQLSKMTDKSGNVQALAINGNDFGFSTTRVKK